MNLKKQRNPFKFLDSYTIEDRDLFFGRNFEIAELYKTFFTQRLTVVYGESGSGKTSLIQCGLQAEIPEDDALFLPVRVANSGVEKSLRQEIKKQLEEDIESNDLNSLLEELWYQESRTLVLILDQFEEFFLLNPKAERHQFTQQLAYWLNHKPYIRIIISIREEYYARLTELENQLPELFSNRLWVRRMTREQAHEVITKPCEICGITIETELTEKLLNDLTKDDKEIDLPTLQVVLDSLYHKAKEINKNTPILTLKDYKNLGEINNILASFIENRIAAHGNGEAIRQVLKAMITAKGTKTISKLRDIQERLISFGPEMDTDALIGVLQQLSNDRIIREDIDNGLYELRHDSLANTIQDWMTGIEKELVEIRQMIDNRYQEYKQRGTLLNHETLQLITPYEAKLNVNNNISAFIEKSKNISRKKRRRLFLVSTLLVLSIITAISFSWWQALEGKAEAERQKIVALEKTAEAERQKAIALNKTMEANEQKRRAEEQTKKVKKQKEIVEAQTKEVQKQKERAEQQAKIAKEKTILATKQAEEAEKQKNKALEQTKKAEHRFGLILNEKAEQAFKEKDFNAASLYAEHALLTLEASSKEQIESLRKINTGRETSLIYSRQLADSGGANIVRFSPDGKTLVSAISFNRIIQIWDVKTGNLINTITLEKNTKLEDIKLHPNGDLFAISSYEDIPNAVKIWSIKSKKIILTLDKAGKASHIAFSPNGKQIATSPYRDNIQIWEISTGKLIKTFPNSSKSSYIAYSPDGKSLASGEYGAIKIWDIASGQELKKLVGYQNHVKEVSFSPNGQMLAAAFGNGPGKENRIELWDISTEKVKFVLRGHSGAVSSVDFSPNGRLLVSSSRVDGTIKVWNIETGLLKLSLKRRAKNSNLNNVRFGPDGKKLASITSKALKLWSLESSLIRYSYKHDPSVHLFKFNHSGKKIASILPTNFRKAMLWDVVTGKLETSFSTKNSYPKSIGFSPDNKFLAVASSSGVIEFWDLKKKKLWKEINTQTKSHLNAMGYSPNGREIATIHSDGSVQFWDIETEKKSLLIRGKDKAKFLAFNLDGTKLAVSYGGGVGSTVTAYTKVWSTITGELQKTIDESIIYPRFTTDGDKLITSQGYGRGIKVWDLKGNRKPETIMSPYNTIGFDLSPDNKTLLSVNINSDFMIWNLKSRKIEAVLNGHDYDVRGAIFSPDGRFIASGSEDDTLKIWNRSNIKIFNRDNWEEQIKKDEIRLDLELGSGVNLTKYSGKRKETPRWLTNYVEHWLLKLKKEPDNADYMYQIGLIYDRDNNRYRKRSKDHDDNLEAIKWYQKAINAGSKSAEERLKFLTGWLIKQKSPERRNCDDCNNAEKKESLDNYMDQYLIELNIYKELVKSLPDDEKVKYNLSNIYYILGGLYEEIKELEDAVEYYNKALKIKINLANKNQNNIRFQRELLGVYDAIGKLTLGNNKFNKSLEIYLKSLDVIKKIKDENPTNLDLLWDLSVIYYRLSFIKYNQNKNDKSSYYATLSLSSLQELSKLTTLGDNANEMLAYVQNIIKATKEKSHNKNLHYHGSRQHRHPLPKNGIKHNHNNGLVGHL